MLRIRPRFAVELRRFEVIREQIPDDIVGEQLHSAISVVDHEPFTGAEQFM